MIIEQLKKSNALLEGHFLLSSGKHSNKYIQCAKLLSHPDLAEQAIKKITDQITEDVDLVVGPAMGGIIVSYEVARQLNTSSIFLERNQDSGEFELRRGFEIKKDQKVIVTEDVITTGKSILETIKVVESYGAEVVALVTLVDRQSHNLHDKYKIYSGTKINFDTYTKEECPLCKDNIELIQPGSRKIFK